MRFLVFALIVALGALPAFAQPATPLEATPPAITTVPVSPQPPVTPLSSTLAPSQPVASQQMQEAAPPAPAVVALAQMLTEAMQREAAALTRAVIDERRAQAAERRAQAAEQRLADLQSAGSHAAATR